MKKIVLALAALSFSAGAALAENPYVGRTDIIQSGPNAGQAIMNPEVNDLDMGTTASITSNDTARQVPNETNEQLADPGANRYGDSDPGSMQYD